MDKEVELQEEKPKKKKHKESKYLEEITSLKEECALKDEKILRISAEMQNMKRRMEDEKSRLLKYDGEEIITRLLTILDTFEHAISMDDNILEDELSKFLSGFKMIYGNMLEVLKSFGVEEIPCFHQLFNENTMNAVMVEQNEEYEHNVVLDVLQKGYMYKDKVLRPAMVKVNNYENNKKEDE